MDEQDIIQRNIAWQRDWYGEPLGDRLRRLIVAFDISQSALAETLGISKPMLSQVISGRRAKIGNPAVLSRLIMLERKIMTPAVASGDPLALAAAVTEVRDSNPSIGRDNLQGGNGLSEGVVHAVLREVADTERLEDAADLLEEDFPAIADLLRRAGKGQH